MTMDTRRGATKFNKVIWEHGKDESIEEEINQRFVTIHKTADDLDLIFNALKENVVCSTFNDFEIGSLANSMKLYSFSRGELVIREGDLGSHFFIIKEGEYEVSVKGEVVNVMKKGKAFGELALIHNTPRTASVLAKVEGLIWGVTRETFRNTLKQLSKRNVADLKKFIDSLKMFDLLTKEQKNSMYAKDEVIVKKGDKGDELFFIKDGKAKVMDGVKVLKVLIKGEYFGELALLYDEPRSATIIADDNVVCLKLHRDELTNILGHLQTVLYRNTMFKAFLQSPVFSRFNEKFLSVMADNCLIKEFQDDEIICDKKANPLGLRYVVVLDGALKVYADSESVKNLVRGEGFGNSYVLHREKAMSHNIVSVNQSKVAIITTTVLTKLFGTVDITETINNNRRKEIVKKIYVFRYLSEKQIDMFVSVFKTVRFFEAEPIIKENEIGSRFFIIKEGDVAIYKGGRKIRNLGKNDYFGERVLLKDEPRSASVQAVSEKVDLWVVDKAVFLSIIQGPMLTHLLERIKLQDTAVSFDELNFLKVIGRGTFGVVKLVVHKPTGERYALKCVSRRSVINLNQQEHIKLEREIASQNDHPLIINLVRTFKDKNYVYLLTELVTGGELFDAIRVLGILNRKQAQFYIACIALATEYLHIKKIAYRDLKPENVLIDNQGYTKLIDFGCAKKISHRSYTLVGTPHYMAPEVILGKGYGTSVDIWSLGVCFYEFICGPLPFANDAEDQLEIFRDILTHKLQFPSHVHDKEAQHLIQRLLTRSPEHRIACGAEGYQDLKEHAFFESFEWDGLLGRQITAPLTPKMDTYAEETIINKNEQEENFSTDIDSEYEWDKDF